MKNHIVTLLCLIGLIGLGGCFKKDKDFKPPIYDVERTNLKFSYICIDGYKYIVTGHGGISQVFENNLDKNAKAVTCEIKRREE